MSGVNHPTNSQNVAWDGASVPRLIPPGHPNQGISSADVWPFPSSMEMPLPQHQTTDIQAQPGLQLGSSFTASSTHSTRQRDASITGNAFHRPAHMPLSVSRNLNAVQGTGNPGSIVQPVHRNWTTTATNNEDVDNTPAQRPPRKPRTRQPGDAEWRRNKSHIEKLYMKDDLPLAEVMLLMERQHNFSASERMYKNKFKIWRWSKNLPHDRAVWMTEKFQQRWPAKTVFYWNNQEWNEEKLVQLYGKALRNRTCGDGIVVCAPTPNDIDYKTPAPVPESPRQAWTAASQPQDLRNPRQEPKRFYLDSIPVNLELCRTTISDLDKLLKDALRTASAGKNDEADADFRDAVSGFRFLLSPTHEKTLRAGYLYASFHANCANMDRADAVLNWMSEKHLERWGPEHEKTYVHYARMVELFRCWGRQELAEILVYKLLDDTPADFDEIFLNSTSVQPRSQHRISPAEIDLAQSFPETDDPEAISNQLDKIDLAIMTDITGLDNVLEVMIKYCEDKSEDLHMSLQTCRAKCALAKLHNAAGRIEETHQVLNSARKSLAPLLLVRKESISQTTIEVARRLSFLFFEAQDESSCRAVLNEVIASLEAQRHIPGCERKLKDAFIINLILEVAFQFHEAASWDKCRYWVERGLGLAMRLRGRKSSEARRFEKILEKEEFGMRTSTDIHDLMNVSEELFQC